MLVLSRKVGEEIRIGQDVVLCVTRIRGNYVHLGISAPRNVRIVRGELPEEYEHDEEPQGAGPQGANG